jgi:hemin uptake protein HemP
MNDRSRASPERQNSNSSPATDQRGDDASPRVISSDSLLAGQSQLAILHNQTVYFLRQTRFGKLILTK